MNNKLKLVLIAFLAMAGLSLAVQTGMDSDTGNQVNIAYNSNVKVEKYDSSNGIWVVVGDHSNLLVNTGKEYIKTQIGSGSAIASNSTKYMSLSNDATAPDAAWTVIPSEINANGLSRATATYAANGTGAWNYTYTWTASGSQSAQLTGLNYAPTATSDGNLFAALQFTSTTLAANDQLRVIWSISVS